MRGQLRPTLCDPMHTVCLSCQLPLSMGFSRQECWSGLPRPPPGDLPDPGIESVSLMLLELAGGFFTITSTWKAYSTSLLQLLSRFSRVRLCATPWTVTHKPPLSMGFYRQEYWSGLPFPSPGDLFDPGIKPRSPAWHRFFTNGATKQRLFDNNNHGSYI